MNFHIIDTFEEEILDNILYSFETLEEAKIELSSILAECEEKERYKIIDKFGKVVSWGKIIWFMLN